MLSMLFEAALRTFALTGILWIWLTAFGIRDARVQTTIWRTALIASLLMPLLMQLFLVQLHAPLGAMQQTAGHQPILTQIAAAITAPAMLAAGSATADIEQATISWAAILWWAYLAVAATLLARLGFGLVVTWRTARGATPIRESWTRGLDARMTDAVSVPVTFGATVLLPTNYRDWPPATRQAVMVHERSHAESGDFYIQLLSSVNRALFWFNPLAWWLDARLTELAEIISDDTAIEEVADRPNYAEVLLDMSNSLKRAPAGVAMARPATVGRRIERILAATPLTARLNWGKKALLTAIVAPLVVIAAVGVAPAAPPPPPHKIVAVSPAMLDSYVGYYQFDPSKLPNGVLTVTREGDHLSAQLSGQGKAEIFPDGPKDFFYTIVPASITFETDDTGRVTGLTLHQNGLNLHATRTTADAAARASAVTAEKIAEQQKPRTPVSIDPKLLDGYVGHYKLGQEMIFTVTREGDHLFAQLSGQPKFEVYPSGPKDFFYTVAAAQLTFVTDANGRAKELILHQNGRDVPAPRID